MTSQRVKNKSLATLAITLTSHGDTKRVDGLPKHSALIDPTAQDDRAVE